MRGLAEKERTRGRRIGFRRTPGKFSFKDLVIFVEIDHHDKAYRAIGEVVRRLIEDEKLSAHVGGDMGAVRAWLGGKGEARESITWKAQPYSERV